MTIHQQPCMFPGPVLHDDWPFGELEPWSYDFIMADPPWRFELYSAAGEEKSAQAHYKTMDMQAIAELPVSDLAKPDCLLWLWCTAPLLDRQLEVARIWGFKFLTEGVWVKQTINGKIDMGTGYRLRGCHEPFILASRGNPKTESRSVRSVLFGHNRGHSRKPEEAFQAAEELMPDAQRLELFSRQNRSGWHAWD